MTPERRREIARNYYHRHKHKPEFQAKLKQQYLKRRPLTPEQKQKAYERFLASPEQVLRARIYGTLYYRENREQLLTYSKNQYATHIGRVLDRDLHSALTTALRR